MFKKGIQFRNRILTIQYSVLGEDLIIIIFLSDSYYLFKKPFIVCECTIECKHGNINLISYFVRNNLSLFIILSLRFLISILLINTNLLTKLSNNIIIHFLKRIDSKTI